VAIPSRNDPTTIQVSAIDWLVRTGEFWVVAGLPGCGKSQLLEVVAGLTPPREGATAAYAADGAEMTDTGPPAPWKQVGLIFADGGRPFNQLTVAQNVGLPLCYQRGCPLADVAPQVQQLLEWTGLAAYSERLPSHLNRGLRQRIALARALALEPSVLLLDNPLSGLAVSQARWWLDFLAHLPHSTAPGFTVPAAVAVTTDDLRPWLGIGTNFALIDESHWRLLGGRAEVAASSDPVVKDLLADPS
jgi:ABC-type transporter Mla maintaining outer membrane lipid asymmetry ATPase subunit MlaF